MSRRKLYLGIAGLLVGLIGLAALWFPVYLDAYDAYGIKINCGNGIGSHLALAHHDDTLSPQCNSALLVRRAWAIPAVAVGWLLVTWFVMAWVHVTNESDEPEHLLPHPEIASN